MSSQNAELIRTAYRSYAQGDVGTMLRFVHPDLEWTYLDPSVENPAPQVCHGRTELEAALARWSELGLKTQLEEVIERGDKVMVVSRTPGVDVHRVRKADDRSFSVFTVRDGRIVALRDCGDRQEALRVVGVE